MTQVTYTSNLDEFAAGFRGAVKRLRQREQAFGIAQSLIAQGWQVSVADEAVTTTSIYFHAARDGRAVNFRIADHSASGYFQCAGLRDKTGRRIQVAPYTKIAAVVVEAARRLHA